MSLDDALPLEEIDAFQRSLSEFGQRSVRLHANQLNQSLPFATSVVPWYPAGRFMADSSIRPSTFLNYAVGDYYIQDAASMLPLAMLDLQPGQMVCDLCAAPGGKASAIAERLGANGFLLANESVRTRVDVLGYALARTGSPNYAVCSYDPDLLTKWCTQVFDIVLVDAPCSGQTLVGRNKRDENAFALNQIEHCAMRQKRILQAAAKMLKPGGQLIYSTCTFAVEENEAQIEWMLADTAAAWSPMEFAALEPWRSKRTPGCYRLWPHRDSCAGGFAASLRKSTDSSRSEDDDAILDVKRRHSKKNTDRNEKELEARRSKGRELLESVGKLVDLELDWQPGSCLAMARMARELSQRLGAMPMQGMALAIETGNHWIPTQGLAMLDRSFFAATIGLELTSPQGMEYVQGHALARVEQLERSGMPVPKGWCLATWNNRALGWLKGSDNRYNNHLPPWARITVG
jgi:16S rRNA C967 or C1407 C5-methylase (RsmB/RsmF family)